MFGMDDLEKELDQLFRLVSDIGDDLEKIGHYVEQIPQEIENKVIETISPLEAKVERAVSQLTLPTIPALGDLSNLPGISGFASAVSDLANPAMFSSIVNSLSSTTSASRARSQDPILSLLTSIEDFVVHITALVNTTSLSSNLKTRIISSLNIITHAIEVAKQYWTLLQATGATEKILNHLQQFEHALDEMSKSFSELSYDLEEAFSKIQAGDLEGKVDAKVILGVASLALTVFGELVALISTIVPLEVGVGASGGVAAGVEAAIIGKLGIVSLGPATFGTIGFCLSTLTNILDFVIEQL